MLLIKSYKSVPHWFSDNKLSYNFLTPVWSIDRLPKLVGSDYQWLKSILMKKGTVPLWNCPLFRGYGERRERSLLFWKK